MTRQTKLTMVLAVLCAAMGGRAFAQSVPVHESTDRITGATVRVYRSVSGPRLEISAPTLSLTKYIAPGGAIVTTLGDSKEAMRIEVTAERMVVTGTRGHATAATGDQAAAGRARDLVGTSPLARKAAALIGRMGFGDSSPIQPLLLTTRAFLLAAAKDDSGLRDLMRWMNTTRSRAHVVPVSLPMGAQKSSSQCWKEYGDEILSAYDDFVDCMNSFHWYDPFFPVQRCEIVYEARILAAFASWMNCLGVMEPSGN